MNVRAKATGFLIAIFPPVSSLSNQAHADLVLAMANCPSPEWVEKAHSSSAPLLLCDTVSEAER